MTERALAWRGYMGRGTQTAIITGVPATKFQSIYACGLKLSRPNKSLKAPLRKTRGKTVVVKGKKSTAGACSGPLVTAEIMWGVGWADLLGNNNAVSGDAATGYTHTFSEPTTAAHQVQYGATVEVNKGSIDTTLEFDFIGSFLKSLNLEFPENGEVIWSADYLGVTEETGGTLSTCTYGTGNPAEDYMVDIKVSTSGTLSNVASVEYKSGNWKYDNGVMLLWPGNSATPTARAFAGNAECTGSIVADLQESLALYNCWASDTNIAMQIIITHTELAGSSSGVFKITITMPRVQIMGEPPDLAGEELVPITYNYEAMKHATLGYTVQVAVVNSESGAYTGL